jgi:FxsC-like protein
MEKQPGKIITFYSYKGGTGRSMTLANVAWILASKGKRVLVLDWDLEAPGLHRYFHPFLVDKELTSSDGLIDFVFAFAAAAATPESTTEETATRTAPDKEWYTPYANILRYASSLDWKFKVPDRETDGSLDFIPAGRQGHSYSTRVNSFNWQNFYDKIDGGTLLEMAKERMRAEYDYVLIDSRTGVSDTSGICTVQMPDTLVVCFTLNNQSIEGAGAVADSVHSQRPEIRIFPVPTRVEKSEKERLDLAREVAHARFDQLLDHLDESERGQYWGRVEIFYEPFYAYEEMLAAFGDKPHQTNSLLASNERLTAYLTQNAVSELEPVSETDRQIVLAKYARQTRRPQPAPPSTGAQQYYFYLSYSRDDDIELIENFFRDLSNEVRLRLGLSPQEGIGFFDQKSLKLSDEWDSSLTQALDSSRLLVPLYSPSYFKSEHCGKEFQFFLDRAEEDERYRAYGLSRILPIIWIPSPGMIPEAANRILYSSPDEGGLRLLMRLSRQSEKYVLFVDQFATALVSAARQVPPPAQQRLSSLASVRSAFEEPPTFTQAPELPGGGPRTAFFVYAVGRREEMGLVRDDLTNYGEDRSDWRPLFPRDDAMVGMTAASVTIREAMQYQVLPFDDNLVLNARQAEQNNSSVILIVDPWTTLLPHYREILQKFDAYSFVNCAILIIWGEDDDTKSRFESLRSSLRETFPYHMASAGPDWHEIRSNDEFQDVLSRSLQTIRLRIIERGQVMKRIDIETDVPKPELRLTSDAT